MILWSVLDNHRTTVRPMRGSLLGSHGSLTSRGGISSDSVSLGGSAENGHVVFTPLGLVRQIG